LATAGSRKRQRCSAAFTGKVGSGVTWTNDIPHGALIHTDPNEVFTIDACDLRPLFPGHDPNWTSDYNFILFRPDVLTLTNLIGYPAADTTMKSTPTAAPLFTASVALVGRRAGRRATTLFNHCKLCSLR
jgi:hypothetical protein